MSRDLLAIFVFEMYDKMHIGNLYKPQVRKSTRGGVVKKRNVVVEETVLTLLDYPLSSASPPTI